MNSEKIKKIFENKKVLILGFGKEGKSSYELINNLLPEQKVYIMDKNNSKIKGDFSGRKNAIFLDDKQYLEDLNSYDVIMKTPGISGYLLDHVDRSKIYSQTNIFLEILADRVIGITGTKGKSTTSSLTYISLQALGYDVELVGNIGRPALDLLMEDKANKLYVYEMSSYQTEFIVKSPKIGLILNFYQDHLDHYRTYKDYLDSKIRLWQHRDGQDSNILIYGCENKLLKKYRQGFKSKNIYAFGDLGANDFNDKGIFVKGDKIVAYDGNSTYKELADYFFEMKLIGRHNRSNVLAALLIASLCLEKFPYIKRRGEEVGKIEDNIKIILKDIEKFEGLEHRMEFVGNYKGISFYNDSIATVPEATMLAIESITNLSSLIVGGFDKGIDYNDFIKFLNQREYLNIICLPKTGHDIYEKLIHKNKVKVDKMDQAVEAAYKMTKKGASCLMSCAAASFVYFINFEDRGRKFKEAVRKLAKD